METPAPATQRVRSIAQRSVILPNTTSAVTIVTIPWEDLGNDISRFRSLGDQALKNVASKLFGAPRSEAITSDEYSEAVGLIQGRDIWYALATDYSEIYSSEIGQLPLAELDERLDTFARALEGFEEPWDPSDIRDPRRQLARHSILYQLENGSGADITQATLFPGLLPISFMFENVHEGRAVNYLAEQEVSPEAFLLTLRVHETALRPSYRIRNALEDLYQYDIPFGGSPRIEFRNILSIIRAAPRSLVVRLTTLVNRPVDLMTEEVPTATVSLIDYEDNLIVTGPPETSMLLVSAVTREAIREEE